MSKKNIQPKKEDEIYCPNCATPIKKEVVICPHCKAKLKELKVSEEIKVQSPVKETEVKKKDQASLKEY